MRSGATSFLTGLLLTVFIYTNGQVSRTKDTSNNLLAEKLHEYLVSAHKAYRFNGTALVMYDGDILLNKGYGFSNISAKTQNAPNTRFPILSITKSFTATVILKLQEAGELSVKDNLSKYFPDYPNGEKIKVHHLLAHTSGIYNYTDDVGIEDSTIVNYPLSRERVLDQFIHKPPAFSPGEAYSYNNSGYFLLGLIIEKVTGKLYETVLRELIFDPLEMNNSGFDFINLPGSIKAQGYEYWKEEGYVPYKHYDSTFAYSAGSVYSTTSDMSRWAQAVSGKQILSSRSWKLAFTPNRNNYGYGWQLGKYFGEKYVKHSGGYPGFMSEFIHYPGKDLTIVLLNNFGTYGQNVWAIGMGLSSIALNLPYDKWALRKSVTLDKGMLDQITGAYRSKKKQVVLSLKDEDLFITIPGIPQLQLQAENESQFYLEDFNTQFSFIKNDKGEVNKMLVREHGQNTEWIKIK